MTVLAEPPLALFRFVTVGMLPQPLREQYGLSWDHRHDRFLRLGTTVTRTMLPLVPPPIRRAPLTYFNLAVSKPRRRSTGDAGLDQQIDDLLDHVHPAVVIETSCGDILVSAAGMAGDGLDRLDLKITSAAMREMRAAFRAFEPYVDTPEGDDLRVGPHVARRSLVRAGARRWRNCSPSTAGWSSRAPGPGSWPPASKARAAITRSASTSGCRSSRRRTRSSRATRSSCR